MLSELNKDRHKALKVLAEYLKTPPRDLQLCAILKDVKDKDLRWVNEKIHYYLLRLLEESEYNKEEEEDLVFITE
tara:strand:- start:231 stop:455 length:225 start_codon:yes stop_codon:yes gene_type:complete